MSNDVPMPLIVLLFPGLATPLGETCRISFYEFPVVVTRHVACDISSADNKVSAVARIFREIGLQNGRKCFISAQRISVVFLQAENQVDTSISVQVCNVFADGIFRTAFAMLYLFALIMASACTGM